LERKSTEAFKAFKEDFYKTEEYNQFRSDIHKKGRTAVLVTPNRVKSLSKSVEKKKQHWRVSVV
jgi:G:T/U-mismatch repair DNA glycosylase